MDTYKILITHYPGSNTPNTGFHDTTLAQLSNICTLYKTTEFKGNFKLKLRTSQTLLIFINKYIQGKNSTPTPFPLGTLYANKYF